jgi:hypothetical protein
MKQLLRAATPGHDLAGLPVGRVLRRELLFKVMPFGYFGGGANLAYVARLAALHGGGRWPHAALQTLAGIARRLRRRGSGRTPC